MNFFSKKYIISVLTLFLSFTCFSQNLNVFEYQQFFSKTDTLNYRILYPKNFDSSIRYSVILFLHGSGERGNNNESQLVHGSKLFLDNYESESFPAIVIAPQCPLEDYWSNVKREESKKGLKKYKFKRKGKPTKALKMVIDFMDVFIKNPYVKKDQVYVGGLSMGGMGTFDILKWRADMFAAAFPICGGGHPKSVKKYANNVSFWIFHGGEDDVVHPYFSLTMLTALQKQRADVRFTYLENNNHNSWDSAFAEPELFPWLFSKLKH